MVSIYSQDMVGVLVRRKAHYVYVLREVLGMEWMARGCVAPFSRLFAELAGMPADLAGGALFRRIAGALRGAEPGEVMPSVRRTLECYCAFVSKTVREVEGDFGLTAGGEGDAGPRIAQACVQVQAHLGTALQDYDRARALLERMIAELPQLKRALVKLAWRQRAAVLGPWAQAAVGAVWRVDHRAVIEHHQQMQMQLLDLVEKVDAAVDGQLLACHDGLVEPYRQLCVRLGEHLMRTMGEGASLAAAEEGAYERRKRSADSVRVLAFRAIMDNLRQRADVPAEAIADAAYELRAYLQDS